jgi:hypothetical protein
MAYAAGNITEAKYGHRIVPWLSPSIAGVGQEHLDKNFFRRQLDLMFEMVDGIGLYNPPSTTAARPDQHAWWQALEEFLQYLHTPTQFTVTVAESLPRPESFGGGPPVTKDLSADRGPSIAPAPTWKELWSKEFAASDSLGSVVTIAGALAKPEPRSYSRIFFLGSAYRRPDSVSESTVAAADRFAALLGSAWTNWRTSWR